MDDLKKKADLLRALCLISTTEASSGHPTSCLSSVDLTTVLFNKYFSYDIENPKNPNNDRLIFSKGHCAPLLYSLFALSGGFRTEDLLSLRRIDSELEGHPTTKLQFVEAATGSLGQGLSIGCGISLCAKKDNLPFKTFVLLGDGEIAEGQIYEACNFASFYKLNNLIAIADINGLGQTGKTMFDHDMEKYENIFSSLGFITKTIDGHKFLEIDEAFDEAVNNKTEKPFMILAKTIKGKGISFLEGKEDMHGKALSDEDLGKALVELSLEKEIIKENKILFNLKKPEQGDIHQKKTSFGDVSFGNDEMSTREAFGEALITLGQNNDIYVLDGDVSNSTYTDKFKKEFPERFIECFIAEQNMVGVATGLSSRGKIPFVTTFGAFLTRAFDQIRMANISGSNIKFVGSHAGISIGEDGPSQMALEDIAMFSSIPDSVILQPCDEVSCKKLTLRLLDLNGITFLRTLRSKTKTIYNKDDDFRIGGSNVLKASDRDLLVIVATGITVFEALKAYEELSREDIRICVIDEYSIKPIDKKTIIGMAEKTTKKVIITVEDHYENGGLGDIVSAQIHDYKVEKLAVKKVPMSGDKDSLLNRFQIDKDAIIAKVKEYAKA